MRFVQDIREIWEVPRDLLLRRYPAFVTGGALAPGDVPVFVFHDLEPASFGRKLQHLADNGYRTLSSSEYLDVLTGARPAPDRAVVSAALPVKMVTAMAPANAALTNVRLIVLIVPFAISLGDLVVYGTLGLFP